MSDQVSNNTADVNYVRGKLDMMEKKVESLDKKVDALGGKVDTMTDQLSMTKTLIMALKWLLAGTAGVLGMNIDNIFIMIKKMF